MEKGDKASLLVLGLCCFFLASASFAPEAPPAAVVVPVERGFVGDAGDERPGEIPVIPGHRALTAVEVDELEALSRRLAGAAEREPAAFETLMLVLSREDGGLYKRAVALLALRLCGHGAVAERLLEKDPRAADLDRIARSLDRGSHLAQR